MRYFYHERGDIMTIKEMIEIVEKERDTKKIELKNRKSNINSSYDLAKHDFRVIENINDVFETYTYIIEQLEELQDRIVERNKIDIKDL